MKQHYKIDNIKHNFIPDDIKCNLITLDILFICLPKTIIEYFKKQFFKSINNQLKKHIV